MLTYSISSIHGKREFTIVYKERDEARNKDAAIKELRR